MWFTESSPCMGDGGPCIGRITPAGEIAVYPIPSEAYGLTLGPDGAIWFAMPDVSMIGQMSPSGDVALFAIPNPRKSYIGSGAPSPRYVTVGPDGAIWFTDPGDNSIGRITTAGQVSEYAIPALPTGERVQPTLPEAAPEAITTGPGGLLYFTELNAKAIASVDPNGVPAPPAAALMTQSALRTSARRHVGLGCSLRASRRGRAARAAKARRRGGRCPTGPLHRGRRR